MIETKSLLEAKYRLMAALMQRDVEVTQLSDHEIYGKKAEATFHLSFMPGNRRTLISHGVEVEGVARGRGLGSAMCLLRELAAVEAGVTLMLATVRDDNAAEIQVLDKFGWKRLLQNSTTHCSLWGKQLSQ